MKCKKGMLSERSKSGRQNLIGLFTQLDWLLVVRLISSRIIMQTTFESIGRLKHRVKNVWFSSFLDKKHFERNMRLFLLLFACTELSAYKKPSRRQKFTRSQVQTRA